MSKFLNLSRVCVPLSLDCDLSCRYCYRNAGRIARIPEFNDLMREYLGQLDPTKVQAVVASGGEPLLHFDKVQELFSYTKKEQHKKIMTNGLNLTQEIVDYLNENDIEVLVSNDGDLTEWLRGYDILKDEEIVNLLKQVNCLTFSCVCTALNPDPYQCYLQIKSRFDGKFFFHICPLLVENHIEKSLTDNFDYDAFRKGYFQCLVRDLDYHEPVPQIHYPGLGCNVLPNGELVGMAEIHHTYGTILSTLEDARAKKAELGDLIMCDVKDCVAYSNCGKQANYKSDHFCTINKTKRMAKINLASRMHRDVRKYNLQLA